jgi:hypothetical protein
VAHLPGAFSARTAGQLHPTRPPAGPDWLHEVKHDCYRLLARKEGERVTLWTRYGTDFTNRLPRIAEAVGGLPTEHALIDGEAVVFRPDGRSDFGALRTKAGGAEACLVALDLLTINGEDLRQRPLESGATGSRGSFAASTASCSARRSRPRARSCSPRPARWASRWAWGKRSSSMKPRITAATAASSASVRSIVGMV